MKFFVSMELGDLYSFGFELEDFDLSLTELSIGADGHAYRNPSEDLLNWLVSNNLNWSWQGERTILPAFFCETTIVRTSLTLSMPRIFFRNEDDAVLFKLTWGF